MGSLFKTFGQITGKVTVFTTCFFKSLFITTKSQITKEHKAVIRQYAESLPFSEGTSKGRPARVTQAIGRGIKKSLLAVPQLLLADRLLQICHTHEDCREVFTHEILKMYTNGLKKEDLKTMDGTLYYGLFFVYKKLYALDNKFADYIAKLADKDYLVEYRRRRNNSGITEEQRLARNARDRQYYFLKKLERSKAAAAACAQLPGVGGILQIPPDGWLEEYECSGNFIKWCKDNNKKPPPILHGIPLPYDQIYTAEGDTKPTLYPGDDLPDWLLKLIKNTRKGKEWSIWHWANIFAVVVVNFLDVHKGGVFRKRKPFCIAAMHCTNDHYDLFNQDYIVDDDKNPVIPYHRGTYLKTAWKAVYDAIFEYTPLPDGGWRVEKKLDPKNLFPSAPATFSKEQVASAVVHSH